MSVRIYSKAEIKHSQAWTAVSKGEVGEINEGLLGIRLSHIHVTTSP